VSISYTDFTKPLNIKLIRHAYLHCC